MVANIPYNPNVTSVAQGAFATTSVGLVQGDAFPDPSTIYKRTSGVLAQAETIPMWQGVGIYANIGGVTGGPNGTLGTTVGRATTLTSGVAGSLAGFSVSSYAQVNSPQSPVPLAASGMQVQYFRLGSGQRVVVQADPNLVALRGDPTSYPVSWDFGNQVLVPYASTTVSSSTVYQGGAFTGTGTYSTLTGAVSLTTTNAHGIVPGDTVTITSTAGTGAFASLAGTWTAGTGTTGSTLNFTAPIGLGSTTVTAGALVTSAIAAVTAAATVLLPGDTFELTSATGANSYALLNGEQTAALNTTGTALRFLTNVTLTGSTTLTGGTIATGGILPVQVLDIVPANCMTVNYNSTTGFASWNYNGSAAVILL